jgi:hypothetical protein
VTGVAGEPSRYNPETLISSANCQYVKDVTKNFQKERKEWIASWSKKKKSEF